MVNSCKSKGGAYSLLPQLQSLLPSLFMIPNLDLYIGKVKHTHSASRVNFPGSLTPIFKNLLWLPMSQP